jgi:hypothetical protein
MDAAIVCNGADTSRVAKVLQDNSIELAVYGLDTDRFRAEVPVTNARLAKAIADVKLTGMIVPRYVRASPNSTVADLIPEVSAILIEAIAVAIAGGADRLYIQEICEALFPGGLWNLVSTSEQGRLKQIVSDAVMKLVRGPFARKIEAAQRGRWNIVVETGTARSMASSSRALRRIPARVAKLQDSRTVAPKDQMRLWDDGDEQQ